MSRSAAAQAVYPRLGVVLGRRDTKADIALGQDIAARSASDELAGLVELLAEKKLASSAIKAIYECGYLAPELLVPHLEVFVGLLADRRNRMVWGAMIAISCVAKAAPALVWAHRERIMDVHSSGTVITQVSAVHALTAAVAAEPAWSAALQGWFAQVLREANPKQLVQLAEKILPVAAPGGREALLGIAVSRGDELPSANAVKRLRRLARKHGV